MLPRRRRNVLFVTTFLICLYILIQLLTMDSQQGDYQLFTLDQANLTANDSNWQTVKGAKNKFFVYSAFHDPRREPKPSVRIIGTCILRPVKRERFWCHLWYNREATEPFTQQAVIKVIREHGNLKYAACFVSCPLVNSSVPITVSVSSNIYEVPTNQLRVIDNYSHKQQPVKLSVCIKPLHYQYNKTIELLEFIELYKLLGSSHFTFYEHSVSTSVSCVLRHYVAQGEITVLPWQVDLVSQKEVRTEDMFAALNDCVYRDMYRYSNVAMVDLDEFIIPRHNDTLLQLIDHLDSLSHKRTVGSYVFQNAFFYRNWPDDLTVVGSDKLSPQLLTLTKTRMKVKLLPFKQRSKYIIKPERIVEAGNHFVWQHVKGAVVYNVNSTMATSQHYRTCEFGGEGCIETTSKVDRLAHRYGRQLVASVTDKWQQLRQECGLDVANS